MNNSNAIELKQLHQFLPEITPKQKDCLLLWMLGLSIQSIAAENGVCEKTVRRHLDDARNLYGRRTSFFTTGHIITTHIFQDG
ncbi:helix-turn-helix transcriptional regulator [Serratia fonticola]|uniref:LuxR C-terminal-related transcriptional regulator n=1 Tax=Serratia fonticola TaxID=47917 RepID=A0ABY9PXE9_SERFO|nr:sigma factor-like helix-turn-helix DNA-binding protein [Serratia fonticola]WMT17219.1 LuxR C-terminal-related transcriptional regulator [Serratia fonticola]WMT17228.1 LuxR C-terminal-related transcriptional regulator [Serratia fonticola]